MGQRDAVGLARQTDFATKKTTGFTWPPAMTADFDQDVTYLDVPEAIGLVGELAPDRGGVIYKGTIEGAVRPASFGLICTLALGAATSASPVSGVYTHTFDPLATGKTPLACSVFLYNADPTTTVQRLYYGAYIDKLTVDCAADAYFKFAAEFVAANLDSTQSAPTASLDSTSRFPFHQLTATYYVNGAASASINLTQFSLSWNNALEPAPHVLGSTTVTGITPGIRTIEYSFETPDNLSEHVLRALKTTPDAVRLVITATGAEITTGHNYSVAFDLKKIQEQSAPMALNAGEVTNVVAVSGKGYVDTSTSKSLEVTIKNATAPSTYA